MDFIKLKPFFLIVLILSSGFAQSQSLAFDSTCVRGTFCCGSDPTPAGVMISHVHTKNEWMVSYRYMAMGMAGINNGTNEEQSSDVLKSYAASPDMMTMRMHMLMAMYGVSNKLTAMLMLNYNNNYMEMTMPVGKSIHHHGMSSAGLGDTKVYALYAPIKNMLSQLVISTGLSMPTGSIEQKGADGAMMYAGTRRPYSMQLGSGTVDFLPGITFLKQKNKITYSAQATSVIRTGFNNLNYKLGNEFNLNAWGAWQWFRCISSTLRLEGNLTEAISGHDASLNTYDELSSNPANYGGKKVFTYLGSTLQFKKGFLKKNKLSVEYGLPVYQNLNGTQMKTKNSLYLSWALTF